MFCGKCNVDRQMLQEPSTCSINLQRVMQVDSEDRLQRKKRLFEFYGPKSKADEVTEILPDPKNIDSVGFDPREYLNDLLQKCDLNDLLAKETEISEQIRSLDSEMQTLVYDNYNKFINATHTIKMMKSNFKFIEDEMNSLAESMVEIQLYSSEIDQEIRESSTAIRKLVTTAENLRRLGYLSSLPSKIREFMKKEDWTKAVDAYIKASGFFEKHRNIPSFKGIDKECTELISEVVKEVESRLLSAEDSQTLTTSIEVLMQLGQPMSELSKKFIQVASHCIDSLFEKLDSPQDVESVESSVPDLLNFANAAADTISEGALSYVFAYSSRFLSNATLSSRDSHSEDNLETPLFEFLQSLTQKFIALIDKKMQDGVQSTEISLLVRALERLYARLVGFGRSVLEVVVPPNESSSQAANNFKRSLDEASLNMVLAVAARCCREKQFACLKLQTADCLTDIRHYLVTNVCSKPTNNENEGDRKTLTEIYNEMSRILATNLRDCLEELEPFLSSDNTFAHLQLFRATFCLDYIREDIVTAYLRFLIQFCKELSKCTPSSIPGSIILLMGKLCLDWANSGTIGHLLSMADDFLLIGLPKSSASVQSHQQAIQQMLATRQQPLTPPGPLAEEFRTTATRLLTTFAKFEGAQLAHMMRKSVEARDWLRCLEPRTVRSVIRRILEDLANIDFQVSQLLPPSTTGRGRVGKEGGRGSVEGRYSWRSSMSHLRGQTVGGLAALPTTAAGALGSSQQHGAITSPAYDPALASQLRRLFHQRVNVFAPVKPTRESILFGVVKIGLKAFSECARTRTFGKFGLQQIQVDCHYLHIHLWRFVSDEREVQNVLDDVMYSVMQRCVEPQLMDDSIVDAICDTSRGGNTSSKSGEETITIFLSQLDFEYGLKPRSLAFQEYLEHRLDLSHFDVDYSIKFEENYRGPTADIALDTIESRYLLSANCDGSLLLYDTQAPTETNSGSPSLVFPVLAHLTSVPPTLLSSQHNPSGTGDGRLSQSVCLQWNHVDTGCFFSVSVDNTLKVWDTNTAECVEVIATPESMTWAALSPCAREHNLIAVSLRRCYDRHLVCIDPLVGAPCLSLLGAHTAPLITQVLWSARNSFILFTAGEDGRIIFWDIRVPLKPVATLNNKYRDKEPLYLHDAVAHNGGVKGMANSPDGLHLYSWGGTGARGGSCLRVWGLEVDGGAPCSSAAAQPRVATAALDRAVSIGAGAGVSDLHCSDISSPRCVRLAVTDGDIGPRFHAWGAEGALVFVPTDQTLLVTSVDRRSYHHDSSVLSQWTIKRHFSRMTACAWNRKRLELYTAGIDNNLHTWPLFRTTSADKNSVDE
ncbi:Protein fat-free [Echinococcus granulosus]|uniref:Vacuolar protein sorting-associated protein 51 homolog n=3 Tax=Echinococcus granulosus TaxID=6210 RepID=W6UKC7_ECHGR|nr:Protein fat-free [Echinococcus granulosus]EUB61513.1 Protein fat-free [Echinococcus granulosus]